MRSQKAIAKKAVAFLFGVKEYPAILLAGIKANRQKIFHILHVIQKIRTIWRKNV